jgi:exosortase E/protease (VPEID-CTERM system)
VSTLLDEVPTRCLTVAPFSARLGGLVALLLFEVLALSLRFDSNTILRGTSSSSASAGQASGTTVADPIKTSAQWTYWIFDHSGMVPGLAISVFLAAMLFGGPRSLDEWECLSWRWSWSCFVGHVAALAVFIWLTGQVFEGATLRSPSALAWVVGWFASGLIVVTLLIATALPRSDWGLLARRGYPAVLLGLVVAIAAAGAGHFTGQLWRPLARGTLDCAYGLLGLFSSNLVYEPSRYVVGTDAFSVEIAPQCSGYEGIGLVWAFLGAYLWFFRHRLRFPHVWLLIPLGTAIIWLANAVRIAALVVVGTWVSADIAAGGFHSQAGWLAFNAVALGLVLVSRRMRFFAKVGPAEDQQAGENPAVAALAPLFAMVAVTMVTAAFTAGFDVYYPLRVLAAAGTLYYFRSAYAEIRRFPSWQAVAVGAVIFAVWMALEPVHHRDEANSSLASGVAQMSTAGAMFWLAFRVVGSVVTVPIAEELAFRGYVIRRLVAPDVTTVSAGRFTWLSFLISSALFGALHGRWLAGTLAGMAYALALYHRGEIVDAIVAHATTNALIAGFVLATGCWSLWS